MNSFLRVLEKKILTMDGAMGTMLGEISTQKELLPVLYNVKHPEIVEKVHQEYVKKGADIITTNTFGANRYKLKEIGWEEKTAEINFKAVKIAKKVTQDKVVVLGSISPLGGFLKPFGEIEVGEAKEMFKEQAKYLIEGGVDGIIIETMIDLLELKTAIIGVREITTLPLIAQMSFEEGMRTITGTTPEVMGVMLETMEVDVIGVNCGESIENTYQVVKKLAQVTSKPLIVQPNGGIRGKKVSVEEFGKYVEKFVKIGVNIIGSCCESTPIYTHQIAKKIKNLHPKKRRIKKKLAFTSRTKVIEVGEKFVKIGERINPTGKEWLKEAMKSRDMEVIKKLAVQQAKKGVEALDVNIENFPPSLMKEIVEEIQKIVELPLLLDSQDPYQIEEGLKVYAGKGVINSVYLSEKNYHPLLLLAKKYGASVVGSLMSEKGIPQGVKEKLEVAGKLVEKIKEYNIKEEDIIIDPLLLPLGVSQNTGIEALKVIEKMKKKFKGGTILGISNISYGLPKRGSINRSFLVLAIEKGLDMGILNPEDEQMMETIGAVEYIIGKDKDGEKFLEKKKTKIDEKLHPLKKACIIGDTIGVREGVRGLLESGVKGMEIINSYLLPAIELVGKKYEEKELFLPQLINSTEAVKIGLEEIRKKIKKKEKKFKAKILIATVEGDLHDLGRGLVKMMLEANGYEVIDLGKNISPQKINQNCALYLPQFLCLSCVMNESIESLRHTIKLIKTNYPGIKIIIGGRAVQKELAEELGVYHAEDAVKGVEVIKRIK